MSTADHQSGSRASTAAELLGRCLRAAGAEQVFTAGQPWPDLGLPVVPVGDADLAALLADAAGRIGHGPGVALLPGARVRLSSAPGVVAEELVVADPAELPMAVAAWSTGRVHAASELVVTFDLGDEPSPGLEPLLLEPMGRPISLSPDLRDEGLVVLAGPGVLRAGAVGDLAAFARHAGLGVVNTWGAKGVFRWDDPAHHGTVGLQERDYELAGIAGAPLVLAVGVDEVESPRERWAVGAVLDVEPWQLPTLALRWPEATSMAPRPRLYTELSEALAPLYDPAAPPNPAQAAARLAEALPAGGLIGADPGPVGFWIARCLPTREPGSVVVPATRAAGIGVALAIAAALADRPSVGVTSWPLDETSTRLVEIAQVLGISCAVVAWDPDLRAGEAVPGVDASVVRVGVDVSQTGVLEAVAGPVIAWTDGSAG